MSGWLHAVRRFLDRDPYMIAGYSSYGGSQRVLVRGRAMENEGVARAGDHDSVWRNLVNSYRRIEADPLAFMLRTASTASPDTSCVFGHESGSRSVLENTTLDMPASASVPGSPSAARSDINRYVLAPINTK